MRRSSRASAVAFATIVALGTLPPAHAAGASASKTVPAGQSTVIDVFYALKADCTSAGYPQVTVVGAPQHGALSSNPGVNHPRFPSGSPGFACNAKAVPATVVRYKPAEGYTGDDKAAIEIRFPDGSAKSESIRISVD